MRACVFCGAEPTTKEHVFPQWLLDVIPGDGPIVHSWTAPPNSDSESRTWTADVLTFQAKVVCHPRCNGGWMNALENRVRPFLEPMIRGDKQTLYPEAAAVIAHWALKTAMMIDFAQEAEHRSVPGADYPTLYKAEAVLPNTFVWLGACAFGEGALACARTLNVHVGDAHPAGYGVTLGVGHLVIEIIRVPLEQGQTLQIGGPLATALRRLWPYTNVVPWPMPVLLSREHVKDLATTIAASPIYLS